MKKTILFGGSGFLGHIFLREYSDIISVGRNHPSQSSSEIKNTLKLDVANQLIIL